MKLFGPLLVSLGVSLLVPACGGDDAADNGYTLVSGECEAFNGENLRCCKVDDGTEKVACCVNDDGDPGPCCADEHGASVACCGNGSDPPCN
jgi:hypothetical protein